MARLRKNVPSKARRELAIKYGCVPGYTSVVRCHWCGMQGCVYWPLLNSGKPHGWPVFEHHIDHLIPLARGGSHEVSNLAFACERCNWSRGAKSAEEFRRAA